MNADRQLTVEEARAFARAVLRHFPRRHRLTPEGA